MSRDPNLSHQEAEYDESDYYEEVESRSKLTDEDEDDKALSLKDVTMRDRRRRRRKKKSKPRTPTKKQGRRRPPRNRTSISSEDTRIVNGYEPSERPWLALLEVEQGSCGGALLNARYILSAAHCFCRQAPPIECKVRSALSCSTRWLQGNRLSAASSSFYAPTVEG